ncbi:MBOAT family O-acyltransferase [Flagellimonas sp.]|uniref:MBOAT family O-acyltransferase n=1 Tax=Flagellimonas sp. TaxID=2058762 RepID=UPI003F4A2E3C
MDYWVGEKIYRSSDKKKKKNWLLCSVILNLSILGFFKYFNFFSQSLVDTLTFFGIHIETGLLINVILPVGISFYTFQTMSYSFDIYYNRIKPIKNILSFGVYVAFFPQLVAGPIERASHLLPQLNKVRKFRYDQIVSGLKLILWGMFKKVAIADAVAPMVDDIFLNYSTYSGSTLVLGLVLFSFQIYGDFSGYSDIAIGSAKMLGVELKSNFIFPYFSRNLAEFWRRWHISLSGWFKTYLYIPLGGSKGGKYLALRNIFIVFLISGLWHGANFTFIIWGALHALAFVPIFLLNKNRRYKGDIIAQNRYLPNLKETVQVISTFVLVTFFWVFFRAENLTHALEYLYQLLTQFQFETYLHPRGFRMMDYFVLIILFSIYEFVIRKDERNPYNFNSKAVRFALYTITILGILLFYDDMIDRSFIYFQF